MKMWVIQARAKKIADAPLFDVFTGTLEEAIERATMFSVLWGYDRPKVRRCTFDDLLNVSVA